jgi:essential nuclear protein 1
MPRSLKPTPKSRHDPLHRDIAADDQYEKYGNVSTPGRRKKTHRENEHDEDGGGEVALSRQVNRPSNLLVTFYFSDHLGSKDLQTHL